MSERIWKEDDLLQYELGLLDEDDAQAIKVALQQNPELARKAANIADLLRPLDAWGTTEPPADFVDQICEAAESVSPLEFVAASTTSVPTEQGWGPEGTQKSGSGRFFRLREALALAACLLFFVGIMVPASRNKALQAQCGNTLAGFSQGLSQYAAAFDGNLPSTGWSPHLSWLNRSDKEYHANIQHMAPAVRLGFVVPKNLVCPTSEDGQELDGIDMERVAELLRNGRIRFYSTQNQAGPVARIMVSPRMPLASDTNPVFARGRFNRIDRLDINSPSHAGKGQNVLFADGSVEFMPTPIYKPHQDNIWQAGDLREYTGTEIQRSSTDAFLIP